MVFLQEKGDVCLSLVPAGRNLPFSRSGEPLLFQSGLFPFVPPCPEGCSKNHLPEQFYLFEKGRVPVVVFRDIPVIIAASSEEAVSFRRQVVMQIQVQKNIFHEDELRPVSLNVKAPQAIQLRPLNVDLEKINVGVAFLLQYFVQRGHRNGDPTVVGLRMTPCARKEC